LLGNSEKLDAGEQHALDAIQKQAQECAETVRRIELFARPVPRGTFTLLSVNDVVRAVVELTEPVRMIGVSQGGTGVRLETDLHQVPPIQAHLGDLREALTNLIDNAVAAVSKGGVVTLRTRSAGGEVVVEIVDNGTGIDPLHLRRIFDLFFTTKGPSSSGLGLSIAFNLVSQQGGTLSVDSELGKGTTFSLRFPAAQPDRSAIARARRPSEERRYLEVLVVDDEPLVAGMLQTLLDSVGHRAAVCLGGVEAVEVFQTREFDLVIVDLAMPEMDGWEVPRRINQTRPGVPIIVATGWNMKVEVGDERGAVISAVLKKPLGLEELNDAVADAIRPSPATSR
jgi:CheY-like chemotaxis protein/anti-sigma regulatory factor (Ser/Thr protein kinase)